MEQELRKGTKAGRRKKKNLCYQDNQAVVFAVQLLKSSDPRFQEGILLREAILERGELIRDKSI